MALSQRLSHATELRPPPSPPPTNDEDKKGPLLMQDEERTMTTSKRSGKRYVRQSTYAVAFVRWLRPKDGHLQLLVRGLDAVSMAYICFHEGNYKTHLYFIFTFFEGTTERPPPLHTLTVSPPAPPGGKTGSTSAPPQWSSARCGPGTHRCRPRRPRTLSEGSVPLPRGLTSEGPCGR